MRNTSDFTKHVGESCPLPPDTIVVYRTRSAITPVSHVHGHVAAHKLNWTKSPAMGRILDYAVIR